MDWRAVVRARLPELTGDAARDHEIVEELAQHLAERFEAASRAGASEAEARERALVELASRDDLARELRRARGRRLRWAGPPQREGGKHMLADLGADARYAIRLLFHEPVFAATAILTLALGIGATTAVWSIVDAVLLRPIPLADPDRLVMVWETDRDSGTTREPASLPDFLDFQERSRTIGAFGALVAGQVNLTPPGAEPMRLAALNVSHELLPLMGIRPIAGRTFVAEDDRPGAPEVVLISESLWQRLFSRDAAALGGTLRIDDRPQTIVGVVPSGADFGVLQLLGASAYSRGFADRNIRVDVDVWAPLTRDPQSLPRDTHPMLVVGRLADGAARGAAQDEMGAIAAELERAYPSNRARGVFIEPVVDVVFGPVRRPLLLLQGGVALVLLIACVNVASLLLARGTTRARETAVRAALGAGTRRLARQFVVESTVLTLVAGGLGVLFAFVGLRLLVALAPADIPRLTAAGLNARVLGTAFLASVVVGLVFGMVPIAQGRSLDLRGALGAEGRGASASRQRGALRQALVVAEVALAVVLVVGAGLLIKSFWRLRQVDPGFQAEGVVKAEYQLPATRYPARFDRWPDFAEMHRFHEQLLTRVRALPGVRSAAIAGNHPLDVGFTNSFVVVGREAESRGWPEISVRRVSPDYFSTLGIPLVRGRLLSEADGTKALPVIVINEAAARRFFEGSDPLGQQIRFWGASRTVVGIVGNERFHGLAAASPPAVYAPLAQAPSANGSEALLVRADGSPSLVISAARSSIRAVDPELAVFGAEPLVETLSQSVSERRFVTLVLATFAGLALLLAAIGVHGVLSYNVARRRREIGVRMALGAEPARVVALVVGQGMRLTAIGVALGATGALALGRALGSLLFGVSARDATAFLVVLPVMGGAALLASYLPARRSARVNPVIALRD